MAVAALLMFGINADFKRFSKKRGADASLDPESGFKVQITESEVICQKPDGKIDRLALTELKELFIVTTSAGPWAPDVWWVFVGKSMGAGCSFPCGATGEQKVIQYVEKLPGFDSQTFIHAMGSTQDAKFLCWQAA